MADKYKYIGPVYDFLSNLYSGKSIHSCKTAMLGVEHLKPGDRVVFAGVGHGRDALRAAELGAEVTVVDLSETMLRKFTEVQKRDAPHLDIRKVHCDIMKFEEFEHYDMVIANFFLNVFDEEMMQRVLAHLIKLGKPGAKLVVGDFSYPSGNIFARSFQRVYWYGAVFTFWLFAKNAFHNIYNYPEYMQRQGLRIDEKKHFKMLKMNCYWSILGVKEA
ncbi:class I SAM-dependent methyltransferase [Hydrocarboniclastica marina]|uniref:Class I SAM-dependent methyltransferase n=1 Tax=Hydrocarboniclastica marina TaxID=2259620 RepID=A0A4P7XFV1_9ALTE|nr:class I SAM-dependent methyltransferase [Hydrocarboniclastica marina]MAL99706.1 SAM-dependent methyltransferase [Alteromonadaceae bacterium]QCF25314.1 class I SAM-dependent methyltransferase [Hydrocarboniclastica marina]|tara:strand:+ start:5313 stop:5966 length:654 start_codon:yes stop_codon:yes gene_type:complete